MYWYILGFFTLGMLGVWLLVVLYTMIVKPKEGDSTSTFKKVLKRSGVLVLVYVVTVVVGTMVFFSQYEKECRPNEGDVKVMKPMGKVISNYIIKHGIPKSLKDIPDLPYALIGCNKSQENVEDCNFFLNEVRYDLTLYEYHIGSLSIKIKNRISKTGIYYNLKRNNRHSGWDLVKEKAYSSKSTGICNPMRM